MTRVLEEPFAGLSSLLKTAARELDTHVKHSLNTAADEGREALRQDLMAMGAPGHIGKAVKTFSEGKHGRAIGVAENHTSSDDALEWEFGDGDHFKANGPNGVEPAGPNGTFRLTAPSIAEHAASELAARLQQAVVPA
jgi:hypothetical protein